MSLPGQVYGEEKDTRGAIRTPLGSHLAGHELPELQGEFMPGAADLARVALSLAVEAPVVSYDAEGNPNRLQTAEDFLVPGNPLHDEALSILRLRRERLARTSGYLTVVG